MANVIEQVTVRLNKARKAYGDASRARKNSEWGTNKLVEIATLQKKLKQLNEPITRK